MSSNGARMDYDFGRKKNWRSWAWNRVVERLPVHPSDALVIYLAGADDYDRRVARNKGFRDHNLIAVERDPKAIAAIRANGALCVAGDFFETLYSWPSHTPVHAVIGDLCSGLEHDTFLRIAKLHMAPGVIDRAAFAFNFMRGRETNGLANHMTEYATRETWIRDTMDANGSNKKEAEDAVKHRGLYLINQIAWAWARIGRETFGERWTDEEDFSLTKELFKEWKAITNSYMSESKQRFDSVVYLSFHQKSYSQKFSSSANVSAILAHRTMRMSR